MSNYDGIPTKKAELNKVWVPMIKRFLKGQGIVPAASGHKIYAHASDTQYAATLVFEGAAWAHDFIEQYDAAEVGMEIGYDWWELQAISSYELEVVKIVAG